jgi:septal ring factor EnvC (AmiA/AmiB activator)
MSDGTKFSEDEMKQINELQQTYISIQNSLGQVSVARMRLEQQLNTLDKDEVNMKNKFTETQNKERDFVDSINKKYGDGNLDLGTGIFTPKSPVKENTKKTDKTL